MSTSQSNASEVIPVLDQLAKTANCADALMKGIVALLHERLTRYNWVGFYI
jgi:putative methionine-R-sulfoxide reductase with GAF domain